MSFLNMARPYALGERVTCKRWLARRLTDHLTGYSVSDNVWVDKPGTVVSYPYNAVNYALVLFEGEGVLPIDLSDIERLEE